METGRTIRNPATYQLQHTIHTTCLLMGFSSFTLLWHLLFSPSRSPIFFYSFFQISSCPLLFSFCFFCMNDFAVETPAFFGLFFHRAGDQRRCKRYFWMECAVLVPLKLELFSNSFLLRHLKTMLYLQLGHFAGRLLAKSRAAALQVKLIVGGWMHKSHSLRKCASMAKSWPSLDSGSLVLFRTILTFKSRRWCSSSNAIQQNTEVQSYFSISSTCQLDFLILWAHTHTNSTQRSLS